MSPGAREVRVLETAKDVARAARDELVRAGLAAVAERGSFAVALSGGSTPKALYTLLLPKDLPWEKTQVFFGDERCVEPDRRESNYRMAQEALLSRVPIPAENVHRIRGEMRSPEEAAAEYEAELRSVLAPGEGKTVPRFDLVLLGIGADGHTASLFPGSSAVRETGRLVVATWVEQLSRNRITLTLPVLNAAAEVVFLVAGDEKAQAVHFAIEGAPPGHEVPARGVDPPEGRVLWLLDRLAASRLSGRS